MSSRADHFVAQANSDLTAAQDLARTGRSGQSLGTSMYLCQQSVEKAFKSVLLRLQERAGLEMSEGDLHSLGHVLYPKLHQLYEDNVISIKIPRPSPEHAELARWADEAEMAAARELECFEKLSTSWGSKRNKGGIRLLAWKHSVGIPLDEGGLGELNSFHADA